VRDVGEERLEVDIPDPGHVLAVGDSVVQGDHEDARHAGLERAQRLVRSGGVLDQEHDDRLAARPDSLEAAERPGEAPQTLADVVQRRPERECERCRAGRVVDVVEAR
jgi:hypothetical protein